MSCEDTDAVLKRLVEYYESMYMHDTARFYAERLYYEQNTEEHLHLLAQCYMREGKTMQAYLLLRDSMWPANRYLRARCCVSLDKLQEAEMSLVPFAGCGPEEITADDCAAVPGGASGLFLLGIVCKRENRKAAARKYFELSLDLEPTLWAAATELSEMGVRADMGGRLDLDLTAALGVLGGRSPACVDPPPEQEPENDSSRANAHDNAASTAARGGFTPQTGKMPMEQTQGSQPSTQSKGWEHLEHRRIAEALKDGACSPRAAISLGMSCLSLRVPFATPGTIAFSQPSSARTSLSASRRESGGDRGYGLFGTPNLTPIGAGRVTADATLVDIDRFDRTLEGGASLENTAAKDSRPPTARRGAKEDSLMSPIGALGSSTASGSYNATRLSFSGLGSIASEGMSHGAGENDGAHKGGTLDDADVDDAEHPLKMQRVEESRHYYDKGHHGQPSRGASGGRDGGGATDGQGAVAALIVSFSRAYELLYVYECRECVQLLHCLPRHHFSSGLVQHMLGKAYFEMAEYKPALLALKEMMTLEPFRVKGTEILSTTLWHLKRDKELCSLAQQVVEVDKMSPEAWCVVGNSFSRQREPEAAIKFFERALAIDPTFTYAHTLSGHELVSSEDLERAQKSFRSAIKCDDRHYNAWYGLGAIYTRQERFEMAEYHFRRALSINTSSSVLRCYLGMVLHYQGAENPHKANAALDVLEDAVSRDRSNPQLPFQLAHVLITAGRLEEAKTVLEHLCEVTPREPPVFSLLGQVCQRLGQNQEAYLYYNTAIDLDPREAANLKSAMSSLGAAKDDDDDDDDDDEQGEDEDEDETEVNVGDETGDGDGHGDHSGDMDMTLDMGMGGGGEPEASGEEEEEGGGSEEEEEEEEEEEDYDGEDAYFDDTGSPEGHSRGEL